jgi:hypothetical protein
MDHDKWGHRHKVEMESMAIVRHGNNYSLIEATSSDQA